MMLKTGNSTKGFTLIEVMATVAILSIGIAGLLIAYKSMLDGLGISQGYLDEVYLAKDKMVFLELEGVKNPVAGGLETGEFSGDYSNFKWEYKIKGKVDDRLSELELSIFDYWRKPFRKLELLTYVDSPE